MKYTEWRTGVADENAAVEIAKSLSISSLAARVLVARGIDTSDGAADFLSRDIRKLLSPMLMCDMDRALSRINRALEANEKIAVYGDYDADGITACYIMYEYLKSRGADCIYYIPDRMDEGYGVNEGAVDVLAKSGVTLIITVDTGITAVCEVENAAARGVDFIITDHHECRETLPGAVAVINPHRADCDYPFKSLAGVGVAFKLICALEGRILTKYIPFVCIGTVADIMPLIGENRAIVALGLEMINNCDNLGLTKLLASAGVINKTIDSNTIGFALAPRINAAGRMSSAMRVVELFMEDDSERAHYEAEELCALNKERQEIEINIFKQVLDVIGDVYDAKRDHAIVVAGEGWHHGVIGIVASKITEKFGCPTILISLDGDEGSGSGRSIGSMNLYAALARSKDILIKYGGHAMAVGLSIRRENIDELRHKINDEAAVQLDGFTRSIKVDFKAEPKYLTIPEIEGLKVLEPFGNANLEPCLRIDDAVVQGIEAIGNGRFMRLTLVKDGTYLPCVCFKKTVKDIWFTDGDEVDAVFEPSINDFRGRNVQLVLRDIRPRESKWIAIHETLSDYERFCDGEAVSEEMLRELYIEYGGLGAIWRAITKKDYSSGVLATEISKATGEPLARVLVANDVFCELGLIAYRRDGIRLFIMPNHISEKVNLADSKIICKIKEALGALANKG